MAYYRAYFGLNGSPKFMIWKISTVQLCWSWGLCRTLGFGCPALLVVLVSPLSPTLLPSEDTEFVPFLLCHVRMQRSFIPDVHCLTLDFWLAELRDIEFLFFINYAVSGFLLCPHKESGPLLLPLPSTGSIISVFRCTFLFFFSIAIYLGELSNKFVPLFLDPGGTTRILFGLPDSLHWKFDQSDARLEGFVLIHTNC